MTRVKNTGLLYKVEKVRKYQVGGSYTQPKAIGPVDPAGYHRDIAKRDAAEAGSGYIDKPKFDGNNVFGTVNNNKNTGYTAPSPYVPKPAFGYGATGTGVDTAGPSAGIAKVGSAVTSGIESLGDVTKKTGAGKTAAVSGVVAKGLGMGAEALDNIDDGDERRYTNKEIAGDAASGAIGGAAAGLSAATALTTLGMFAAAGSVVPIIGTAAGLVIGGIVAAFTIGKNKKKAKKAQEKHNVVETNKEIQTQKASLATQDQELAGAPAPTSQTPATAPMYGYRGYNKGGTFARILLNRASENSSLKK